MITLIGMWIDSQVPDEEYNAEGIMPMLVLMDVAGFATTAWLIHAAFIA